MAKIIRPNRPLGDVKVYRQKDGSHRIVACFFPNPDMIVGEGNSKTVLALDASKSMLEVYGISMGGSAFGSRPNYAEMVARKLAEILCGIWTYPPPCIAGRAFCCFRHSIVFNNPSLKEVVAAHSNTSVA